MKGMEVVFTNSGITLPDVIPGGYALKPTYMDHIFSTCMATLPVIDDYVTDLRVVNGFYSRASLFNDRLNKGDKATKEQLAHTVGLAIEVSWKDFNYDIALAVAKALFAGKDKNAHYIIGNESFTIVRHTDKKKIIRNTNGSVSTVLTT